MSARTYLVLSALMNLFHLRLQSLMRGGLPLASILRLNPDVAASFTISSPLDAHKNSAIVLQIVSLDVCFKNPCLLLSVWSTLSRTGKAFDNAVKVCGCVVHISRYLTLCQVLTHYELDLALIHVVPEWSEPSNLRSNLLVLVPVGQSSSSDLSFLLTLRLICMSVIMAYKNVLYSSTRNLIVILLLDKFVSFFHLFARRLFVRVLLDVMHELGMGNGGGHLLLSPCC